MELTSVIISALNFIVLTITLYNIYLYTKETKKLREVSEDNLEIDKINRLIDGYDKEYNSLELKHNLFKVTIMEGEIRKRQYFFSSVFGSFKTYWTNEFINTGSIPDENDCKIIMEKFLKEYNYALNIEKYISQLHQTLLYLKKINEKPQHNNRIYKRLFIRKLDTNELEFLYYYGIIDTDLKQLFDELKIFDKLSDLKFLIHITDKKFYTSFNEKFKDKKK